MLISFSGTAYRLHPLPRTCRFCFCFRHSSFVIRHSRRVPLSAPASLLQCPPNGMAEFDPENLRLTDFLDLPTLQEIQDSFAAVANVKAIITDADGGRLTQPAPTTEFLRRQRAIAAAEENPERPQKEGTEYVAPIM